MTATDKELADAYRLVAEQLEADGWDVTAQSLIRRADLLDPLKPEYPDGTIAWVTAPGGRRYLSFRSGEGWCIGSGRYSSGLGRATNVEPLRVLADDEIALPRRVFGGRSAIEARQKASYFPCGSDTYNVWLAYAGALVAERGDRP